MKTPYNGRSFSIPALLWLLAILCAHAQPTGSISELKSASSLYDRNGWQGGSTLQTDGRMNVSASSGNVAYTYPISEQSLDGHAISVALNYCGAVEHTAFFRYVEPAIGDTSAPYWSRLTQNRPLWLVAVNDFAVQTISMAGNFHQDPQWNLGSGRTTSLSDRDLVWTVDGYDFGNRMVSFTSPNALQSMGSRFIDVIRLLRADGSVLELRNIQQPTTAHPNQRPELYTGYYFANEANSRGFAFVEFDSLNWPEHIRRYGEGSGYHLVPRRVHYYSGDGLEYIFKERVAPYGTLVYSGYNGDTYEGWETLYGGMAAGPTIFYLETITTGSGATIDVSRIRHYPQYENSDRKDSTKGRSFISGLTGHRFSFPITFSQNYQEGRNNSMVIEALGRTITVWFDSVSTSGNGADKFSLAGADKWTTSENSPFSWIREQYKSAAGYVTAIADPENRLTTFTYERVPRRYIGFGFAPGHDTVVLQNFRLTEVKEPTRTFTISYQPIDGNVLSGALYSPLLLNNVVDSVARYSRSGTLLGTDHYLFTYRLAGDGTSGYLIDSSSIISTDQVTGQNISTVYSYHPYALPRLFGTTAVPGAHFTSLYKTSQIAGGDTIVSYIRYGDSLRDPDAARWGTPYLILPTAAWTTVNGVRKSFLSYGYDIGTVRSYGGDTVLAGKLGRDILTSVTNVHRPDDTATVLLIDTVHYLHLPLADTTFTRYDTTWDERKSFAHYYNTYWKTTTNLDQAVRDYWEEVAFDPQVFIGRIDTVQGRRKVPPFFGLPSRHTLHNSAGTILEGRIFTYATDPAQRNVSRGRRLADSIIGAGGTRTILGTRFDYSRWLGKNLPSGATNANGARIGSFYEYQAPASGVPAGTILRNDDEATDQAHLTGVYFAHRFERPVTWQGYVRRYQDSSALATDTLSTLAQRTFFGLVGGTVDANGWYSRNEYDRVARLKKAWRPFDFPQDSAGSTYTGIETIPLYGSTWRVTQTDSVECSDGMKFVYPRQPDTTLYGDSLFAAMRSLAADPACPPCNSARRDDEKKHDRALLTTCNFGRLYTRKDQHIGMIDYLIDSSSALFNAVSLDSAYLQLYVTSMAGECVALNVSIPQFGFTKTYTFNCQSVLILEGVPNDKETGKMERKSRDLASAPGVPSHAMVYLKVNLRPIITDLLSMGYAERLGIYLKVTSPDTRIDFINGSNGADTRPRLVLRGTFDRTRFQPGFEDDYTIAYQYNDDSLFSSVSSKIDDIRHSSNDLSGSPGTSRYTLSRRLYGPEYVMQRSETTIGPPHAPIRLDSVQFRHTGWNRPMTIIDQEGDSTVIHYDAIGRATLLVHPDGTQAAVRYRSGTPAACGITDTIQDFLGFCSATITEDENKVRHARYYDAFNRLRRHIADSNGLAATTMYDYDALGRLTRTVNPGGGILQYTHDAFGRLSRASHPDLGAVSYTYDNVGNIRFSQDAQQAAHGLLTYYQYDDLNRTTLVGEAAIDVKGNCPPYNEDGLSEPQDCGDGTDLPAMLDGSRLQITSGGDILTANPTLLSSSAEAPPHFPDPSTFTLKNCVLDPEPRLHESTAPTRPLIRHPAPRYLSNGLTRAKLDECEDLRLYPGFARVAVHYDGLPVATGPVWSAFPDSARWNSMAPKGRVRNLRGRQAAIAYRERASEPYHFTVMSYDERGRVEAILRHNDNLGFDAVYYTYNSANRVTAVTVADPLRQHTTWYGYDANGRIDTVWTKLSPVGSGLVINGNFSQPRVPFIAPRPFSPDIVYSYSRRNQVEQMSYPYIKLLVDYAYNSQAYLDSLVATLGDDPLLRLTVFSEHLDYSPGGEILKQSSTRYGSAAEQSYRYDNLSRLTGWADGSGTTDYSYDPLGNRLMRVQSGRQPETYSYQPDGSRIISRLQRDAQGNDTTHHYGHNANGGVTDHTLSYNTPSQTEMLRQETLGYSFRNLLNVGRVRDLRNGDNRWYEWRYRYSPDGEREQKRLYKVSNGVVPAPDSVVYPWTYYLLGAGHTQLAVYHGQQFDSTRLICNEGGTRVYMYPAEYRTYGLGPAAAIITRPNGSKEYQIADHLGTPRLTLDEQASPIAGADYGPFGEELAVAGVPRREGYIDRERDPETDLANFGLRGYDPDRGAFAAPEPLWPLMPSTSPYAYVGNNPLSWSDPSGLAGESPQPSPLDPAPSGGSRDAGMPVWQIEKLLGNNGPRRRGGSPEPRTERPTMVGPPPPPRGNRGVKVVPPPIIVEPPVPVREESSAAMGALAITLGAAGALLADDATVIGVVDDPAIPVVLVVGAVVVGCLLLAEALSDGTEDLYDPANADHDRNPAADKKLSDGEIRKLKKRGFDIHDVKDIDADIMIDLYKDSKGNVYIKPGGPKGRGGQGPGEPTYINLNNL